MEHGVILTIKADAADAKRDMAAMQQYADKLRATTGAHAQPGPDGGVPNSFEQAAQEAGASTTAAGRPASVVPATSAGKADDKASRAAGEAIGKFFVTYVLAKGSAFALDLARSPYGGNGKIEIAKSTIGGGIMGGMAGAQLGGMLGSVLGPGGTVLGAGIGALAGLAGGYLTGNKRVNDQEAMIEYQTELTARNARLGQTASISDEAFSRALGAVGTRDTKLAMINARVKDIYEGEGNMSINALQDQMRDIPDKTTVEYSELSAKLQMQLGRVSALKNEGIRESWSPLVGLASGSDYADAYQQRGMTIGNSVNVADLNDKLLPVIEQIRDAILQMAAHPDEDPTPFLQSAAYGR